MTKYTPKIEVFRDLLPSASYGTRNRLNRIIRKNSDREEFGCKNVDKTTKKTPQNVAKQGMLGSMKWQKQWQKKTITVVRLIQFVKNLRSWTSAMLNFYARCIINCWQIITSWDLENALVSDEIVARVIILTVYRSFFMDVYHRTRFCERTKINK